MGTFLRQVYIFIYLLAGELVIKTLLVHFYRELICDCVNCLHRDIICSPDSYSELFNVHECVGS